MMDDVMGMSLKVCFDVSQRQRRDGVSGVRVYLIIERLFWECYCIISVLAIGLATTPFP